MKKYLELKNKEGINPNPSIPLAVKTQNMSLPPLAQTPPKVFHHRNIL